MCYCAGMTQPTTPRSFDPLVFSIAYALSRSPYHVRPSRLGADGHYRLVAQAVVEHLRVCGWRVERDEPVLPGPNGFVGDGRGQG